ncbi:MAG: aminopeptidase [Heliobacteriaceae bacterium]|nr:aminopeptidase [Heliobacteriaceae bacterium]
MVKENKPALVYKPKPVWDELKPGEGQAILEFAAGYREFLSAAKTEREAVDFFVARAREHGFGPFSPPAGSLQPGDRVCFVNRNKGLLLARVGKRPFSAGVMLIGAHLDAPRLDLKPNPLYQEDQVALFKTHYYGGIKKYQWLTQPLALHGTTVLGDGTVRRMVIGEAPGDPVLTITDLLPHLAKDQMEKKMAEAVPGEGLNLLAGGLPAEAEKDPAKEKDRCKKALLALLYHNYGMTEEDFLTSEWQAVPAGTARDVGLDRAFIGGYGQDDRSCCYTAVEALLGLGIPDRTAMVLLVDKEETGSDGNTGMRSRFFENALTEMIYAAAPEPGLSPELVSRRCLFNTRALSADVTAALDPNFPEVVDKRNVARLGYGVAVSKYTGSRGKYGTSDANPEFMGEVRRIFHQAGVKWQSGELGKVDQGGGGTIAQFLAVYGMDVLDCGVPLLSMHAPFEVAHKADLYMTYLAYQAFLAASGE